MQAALRRPPRRNRDLLMIAPPPAPPPPPGTSMEAPAFAVRGCNFEVREKNQKGKSVGVRQKARLVKRREGACRGEGMLERYEHARGCILAWRARASCLILDQNGAISALG
jgi:hypothetical protein